MPNEMKQGFFEKYGRTMARIPNRSQPFAMRKDKAQGFHTDVSLRDFDFSIGSPCLSYERQVHCRSQPAPISRKGCMENFQGDDVERAVRRSSFTGHDEISTADPDGLQLAAVVTLSLGRYFPLS